MMKLTIRKKLFAGFFAVLAILATVVAIGLYEITKVDRTYSELIEKDIERLIATKDLLNIIRKAQSSQRGYLLTGDETALRNYSIAHEEYESLSKKLMDSYDDAKEKQLLQELNHLEEEFYQFSNELFGLKKQNNTDVYNRLILTTGREILKQVEEKAMELEDYQKEKIQTSIKTTSAKAEFEKVIVLSLGIISVLVGSIISWYISRMISRPVMAIAGAAQKIASGDLTADEIKVKNRDEIGDLAKSFNQMSKNLRELIHQVASSAEQVAASAEELTASAEQTSKAAEQIAATMQDVAAGAEKQVQSFQETSQTANEISFGAQQIASNAQSVSSIAMDAVEKATHGGKTIDVAIKQMSSINETVNGLAAVIKNLGERSKEIGQITDVITGIAEQTNLLALNAAIEAARAGEQGRGFAVVADEVRKLAEQSAQSAQQISRLISAIQEETNKAVQSMEAATKEVVSGIGVVNTAGESFNQIQSSINEVTSHIQEISSAIQQMAAGTEQMVQSMQQIAKVAETSAAGTQEASSVTEEQLAVMEEISSSAESLSHMAEELQALIGKFKI
ncbi:methyl-accepting chemotaxis protein [Anoxybacillus vitaminiphilus]|uniref:Methyl-accepting chemotaxis protein n=2 Tax=Paranoxybacillus vitaminiphilus TaxID=581036 RepID=A0A327YTS3_9BACL|nr:methyl-accepting chemotaxis protein [Anoxybacillus vitaminiphilus]